MEARQGTFIKHPLCARAGPGDKPFMFSKNVDFPEGLSLRVGLCRGTLRGTERRLLRAEGLGASVRSSSETVWYLQSSLAYNV